MTFAYTNLLGGRENKLLFELHGVVNRLPGESLSLKFLLNQPSFSPRKKEVAAALANMGALSRDVGGVISASAIEQMGVQPHQTGDVVVDRDVVAREVEREVGRDNLADPDVRKRLKRGKILASLTGPDAKKHIKADDTSGLIYHSTIAHKSGSSYSDIDVRTSPTGGTLITIEDYHDDEVNRVPDRQRTYTFDREQRLVTVSGVAAMPIIVKDRLPLVDKNTAKDAIGELEKAFAAHTKKKPINVVSRADTLTPPVIKRVTPDLARQLEETIGTIIMCLGTEFRESDVTRDLLILAAKGALPGNLTRADLEAAGIVDATTTKYGVLRSIQRGRGKA